MTSSIKFLLGFAAGFVILFWITEWRLRRSLAQNTTEKARD